MAINFIPNDPAAAQPAQRRISPAADRSASRVRFVAGAMPPEAQYAPGTPDFVAWQCREAAWRTLDVFEGICGPLVGWRGSAAVKTLRMVHNGGVDLNAYYDRRSISFFQFPVAGRLVFSGASSDVVAHETGHAILDALRPDLFGVEMMEVAAFHEGFGDCIAIMFALSDQATRQALLTGANPLRRPNFVEATAEQLADAIRVAVSPRHNAAAPRRANNSFTWSLPQTLPANGPPGTLINEAHSLGQLVSGIYYDLIAALFQLRGTGQAALWSSCELATRLAVKAAVRAPVRPRFFEAWGRMMLLVDSSDHGGANQAIIRAAFARHGIAIGTAPFLAPQAAVAMVPRGRRRQGIMSVSPQMRLKLKGLLSLDAASPMSVRQLEIAGDAVAEVNSQVEVDLSGLAEILEGVVAHVSRPTLLGEVSGAVAVLGSVQSSMIYASEVRDFVSTLVRRKAIEAVAAGAPRSAVALVRERGRVKGGRKARNGRKAPTAFLARDGVVTHVIAEKGGQRVIERVAFACGCCRR
jgi:hypothetical protein